MYIPVIVIRLFGITMIFFLLIVAVILLDRFLRGYKKKLIIVGNSQKKGRRQAQEDSFSTYETENGMIAIVADGMGGLEYGKIASSTAVKMFIEEYTKEYELYDVQKFLLNSAYTANDKIVNMANGRKIGTTLIASIIRDNFLHWISVGDSRIYLHRKGELIKLNKEHTYENVLNNLYENGEISKKMVSEHPKKELLTSYIGYEDFHEIDYSRDPIKLSKGDKVLLMSDGIYKSITEGEIREIMSKKCSPDEKCELITNIIEEKNISNQDNMTVIVVEKK